MSPRTLTLRNVLLIDTATCVLTGVLLVFSARLLAELTAIPPVLLFYAGVILIPVAAFMAVTATRTALSPLAMWVIVAGNALWVVASVVLMIGPWIAPSVLGHAFIEAQAVAVAVLTVLELDVVRSAQIAD
jgi:hypothetical protein